MVLALIWNITFIIIGARLDTCHKKIIDELGIDGRLFCGFSSKQFARWNKFIFRREYHQLNDRALNVLAGVYVFTSIVGMLSWLGMMLNSLKI
jgi:hypothetical protein